MPRPVFPRPAAVLPGEIDVLANVVADLSNHDAKLVYADWLEERDDPRGPLLRRFVTAYRAGKRLPGVRSAPYPWREMVGLTLVAKLRETVFAPKTDPLLTFAQPTITYSARNGSDASLPVGASKLGGQPDLPPGAEWPKFKGEPLSFIGQFSLADLRPGLAARELPPSGVLSLFCLHDEDGDYEQFPKGAWRLSYFPDASELVRFDFDEELPEEARFVSHGMEFFDALTLPHLDSLPGKAVKRLVRAEDPTGAAYDDIHSIFSAGNHVLGHPCTWEGDVLRKRSVRHLLSISEGKHDWGWGDGEVMYFTIPGGDLKEGRFDRVRMEVQCF